MKVYVVRCVYTDLQGREEAFYQAEFPGWVWASLESAKKAILEDVTTEMEEDGTFDIETALKEMAFVESSGEEHDGFSRSWRLDLDEVLFQVWLIYEVQLMN